MDAAILTLTFLTGLVAGAFATAVAAVTYFKLDRSDSAPVGSPLPNPPALYKPVDRSDKAVARMERGRNVAQGPNGSTTVFEMQAGPR